MNDSRSLLLERIPFKLVHEYGYISGGGVTIVVVYEPGESSLYLLNFSGECGLVGVKHGRNILDRWSDKGTVCCCLCRRCALAKVTSQKA